MFRILLRNHTHLISWRYIRNNQSSMLSSPPYWTQRRDILLSTLCSEIPHIRLPHHGSTHKINTPQSWAVRTIGLRVKSFYFFMWSSQQTLSFNIPISCRCTKNNWSSSILGQLQYCTQSKVILFLHSSQKSHAFDSHIRLRLKSVYFI